MPGFPGAGTLTLPAEEAHAFTVHDFVKPRLAQVDDALERNGDMMSRETRDWMTKLGEGLRAMVGSPDRAMTTGDLVFAATSRCRCGAGYCYPNFLKDSRGSWVCSAIILGTAAAGSEHDQAKPFTFWSIKGEGQPSANGATTRPAVTPGEPR